MSDHLEFSMASCWFVLFLTSVLAPTQSAELPKLRASYIRQRSGVHGSDRECVLEPTLQETVSQAFWPNSWVAKGLCKAQLPVFWMSGLK